MSRPVWPAGFVCICLIVAGLSASAAAGPETELVPVWLEAPAETAARAHHAVRHHGGRIVVHVPERSGALAWIPPWLASDLERGGARVDRLDVPAEPLDTPAEGEGVADLLRRLRSAPVATPEDPGPLGRGEALVAPDWWELETPPRSLYAPSSGEDPGRPHGADWQNTSEYLAGRVSVNLLLVESDGRIDPDRETWTRSLEDQVVARAVEALADVEEMHPGAGLRFTLHLLSGRTDSRLRTGYEPITRPADPYGDQGVELWIGEVLDALGYPDGARLTRSRLLADATRVTDGSDWAVNVFVANSDSDDDGRFVDGRFAFSWIGGPHAVLTSDNSGWGLTRFHQVLRHELHHAFFALDQYAASNCACTAVSGYAAGSNGNCELDCGPTEPDVMINNVREVSSWTRRQVGTHDVDLDGTPDLLQIPPQITFDLDPEHAPCDGLAVFLGTAEVVPPVNVNPWLVTPRRDISLRRIVDVEVSVNDGAWQSGLVYADDGTFDEPVEPYSFSLALPNGRHRVQVRSVDDRGTRSSPATLAVDAAEDAAPMRPTLRLARGAAGTELSWQAAAGAATYRIRRASRPTEVGPAEPVTEVAMTGWRDTAPGTVFYRVTAVDVCGHEAAP